MKYYPLSYQQRKLYLYSKVHEDDSEYNVVFGLEFKKGLDEDRFENAVKCLLEEEPVLRCRITEKDGDPMQYAADVGEYAVRYLDIPDSEAENTMSSIEKEHINICGEKLFSVFVIKTDSGRQIVLFRLHHIICDGWTLQLMMKRFSDHYFEGKPVDAAKEYTYFEYAEEQAAQLQTEAYTKRTEFWNDIRQEYVSEPDLPYSFTKGREITRVGGRLSARIDKDMSSRIDSICKELRISQFSFFLSVYGDLFTRFSREKKICIAVPVANRFKKNVMDAVGYFVNTIPMAIDQIPRLNAPERLKENQKKFAVMLGKSDTDIQCPCNIMFVFQSSPDNGADRYKDEYDIIHIGNSRSKYEIGLSVYHNNDGYSLEWEYMKELFEDRFAADINKYFLRLMESYLNDNETVTERFSLLNEEEIALQRYGYNHTDEKLTDMHDLRQHLDKAAAEYADETALIYGDERMSYRDFHRRTNSLCLKLREQGVKKGDTVAILFERGPEMVIAIHAIIRSGCAYLPLDTAIPPERMKFILENSESSLLLTSPKFAEKTEDVKNRLVFSADELEGTDETVEVTLSGLDRAYVIYTSGSTGTPKGVVNVHEGIVNRILWMQKQFPIGVGKKVMHKTPYTFDVSVWELIWPLMTGATMVIARPGGHKDPEYIADLIQKENVNLLHFVPSMLKKFLMADNCSGCTSLEYVICSGEALEADTCRKFCSMLDAELANLYGPTEAAIDVSYYIIDPENIGNMIPIGVPISNIRLFKLNKELMFEPPEVPGELFISGIGLAEGYLNSPEKTAQAFIPSPLDSNRPFERLYHTGDLVKLDDKGNIIYMDRIDLQVKIRGQRIELAEIENHIKEIEGIRDAVVIVRKKDNGQQILTAFVISNDHDKERITGHLSKYLMEYMIPRVYCFIDEMPVNTNGKADRKKLAAYPLDIEENEFEPPADEYERMTAKAFEEVLSLKDIGRNADFFECGGTSLSFYDMKIRLEKISGVKIPFELLSGKSVVADVAEAVRKFSEDKQLIERKDIDLEKETVGFDDIPEESRKISASDGTVLLTGATGFLGTFLSREYLEDSSVKQLICLVRAEDNKNAMDRIVSGMKKWNVWKEEYRSRITALCSDLSKPKLGLDDDTFSKLCEIADTICHNGASVNFSLPYEQIKRTNVDGSKEILKILSSGKRKSMTYISTISVFADEDFANGEVDESKLTSDINKLKLGYSQSKCVAEHIIKKFMEKKYDVQIFRIGRITGSMDGGRENEDMFYKITSFCKHINMYPEISMNLNCIPVDIVSKVVRYASLKRKGQKIYHIVNPDINSEIELSELFENEKMQKTDWKRWYDKCNELAEKNYSLARQVMVSISSERSEQKVRVDLSNTKELLNEMDIMIPNIKHIMQGIIKNINVERM